MNKLSHLFGPVPNLREGITPQQFTGQISDFLHLHCEWYFLLYSLTCYLVDQIDSCDTS